MKTPAEITAEIEALRTIKPQIPQFSKFQDDHHTAIDAQIKTLAREFGWHEIQTNFAVENDNYHAIQASDWRDEINQTALSRDWETLK